MSRFKNVINFFKSLKFRLILFLILFGIVPGIVLKVGIVKTYEDRSVSIKTSEILSQAKILANQIVSNDYLNYPNSTIINAELDQLSNIYDGRVMVIDNEFHIIKDTYDLDTNKTIISKEVIESYYGQEIKKYDAENRYIELTVPLSRPVEQTGATEVLGVMLVSVSTDSINLNMEYLARNAYVIQLICAVAAVFLAVILSIQLVKPFHKMSKSIDEIKTGYGEDALSVNDYTETIEICKKFNEMLGRMKVLDDSRQEFVSNVSHELKTPLTSMKVLADSLNSMEDAPIELYKEFMGDIGNEIDREGRKYVNQADLFEAFELVAVGGKEKKDRVMSDKERKIVSYHEVGHAIVTALQKNTEPVQKITIVPRTMGALGYTLQTPEEEKFLQTKDELLAKITTYMAGRAAEVLVFSSATSGAANDIENATAIARAMVTQYGMSDKFGMMCLATTENQYLDNRAGLICGEETAAQIDGEVLSIINKCYDDAMQLLIENRESLDKISEYLYEHETITGKEFMKIFREIKGIPEPEEESTKKSFMEQAMDAERQSKGNDGE